MVRQLAHGKPRCAGLRRVLHTFHKHNTESLNKAKKSCNMHFPSDVNTPKLASHLATPVDENRPDKYPRSRAEARSTRLISPTHAGASARSLPALLYKIHRQSMALLYLSRCGSLRDSRLRHAIFGTGCRGIKSHDCFCCSLIVRAVISSAACA